MNHPDHHLANTLPHPCICCVMLRFAMFHAAIFYSKLMAVKKFTSRVSALFYSNIFILKSLLDVKLFAGKFQCKTKTMPHVCEFGSQIYVADENKTDEDSLFMECYVWLLYRCAFEF